MHPGLCGAGGVVCWPQLAAAIPTAGANQHATVCLPPGAVLGGVVAAGRAIIIASICIDAITAPPPATGVTITRCIAVGRPVPAGTTKTSPKTAFTALGTDRTSEARARTRASEARARTWAGKARRTSQAGARKSTEAGARKRRTTEWLGERGTSSDYCNAESQD